MTETCFFFIYLGRPSFFILENWQKCSKPVWKSVYFMLRNWNKDPTNREKKSQVEPPNFLTIVLKCEKSKNIPKYKKQSAKRLIKTPFPSILKDFFLALSFYYLSSYYYCSLFSSCLKHYTNIALVLQDL